MRRAKSSGLDNASNDHDDAAPNDDLASTPFVSNQGGYNASNQATNVVQCDNQAQEAGTRIADSIEEAGLGNKTTQHALRLLVGCLNMTEGSRDTYLVVTKKQVGASSTEGDCSLEIPSTQFGQHVDAPSVTGTRGERNVERVWQLM